MSYACEKHAMGPYTNAAYGPPECPWGGPREGDDHDVFFLTRGDEDRLLFDSKWGDEEWEDWSWKMEADYVEKQKHAEESAKRKHRLRSEYDLKRSIVLMPRKPIFLKTKYEADKAK